MTAESMVKNYQVYKNQAALLLNRIKSLGRVSEADIIEAMTFSQPEGERVQTSGISDKTAKIALSSYKDKLKKESDDMFDYLVMEYRRLMDEIDFFENALTLLSGYLPQLMTDMIINKAAWSDLERKYGISHSMVGKCRKKALKELKDIYRLKDDIDMLN